MGNNSASAIASHLTRTFKEVKYLFMVGIAGGMPQHVKLGDIVVAKKIVQYDYGKREDSEKFSLKGEPLLASEPLLKVHRYLALQKDPCPWKNHLDTIVDLLSGQNLGSDFGFERPEDLEKHPQVFCETIGSGNTVLKDAQFRDNLSSEYGIYAVEMEGSGIADAATMKGLNFMVIRGICDYCDQSKEDKWHGYAAGVAAAYTKALIEVLPKSSKSEKNCSTEPNSPNYVTISSPKNDGEVGAISTASGTVAMKDQSSNVWVLVHRAILKGQWWSQPEPVVDEDGNWESTVYFGEARDIGGKFEIAVATFSKEAEKKIEAFHKRGMATGNWSIPIKFPKTTSNICTVTVKKTSH